jgi:hypothetical protein
MEIRTEEEWNDLFADYRAALRAAQTAVKSAENENELIAAHDAVVEMHQKMREASDEYLRQKVANGEEFRNGNSASQTEEEHSIMKTVKGVLPMTPARIAFGLMWAEVDTFDSIDAEKRERREWIILNSPDGAEYSVHYANKVIQGRWPDGEPTIAEDAQWSVFYSSLVLKGRFEIAEDMLEADEDYWPIYSRKFGIPQDEV